MNVSANYTSAGEYRDLNDNVHTVTHTTKLSAEDREELENRIVEELYRIFTHYKNI